MSSIIRNVKNFIDTNVRANVSKKLSRLEKSVDTFKAKMQETAPPHPLGKVYKEYNHPKEDKPKKGHPVFGYHGTNLGRIKKIEDQFEQGVFKAGMGDFYFGVGKDGPGIAEHFGRSESCQKPCGKCGSECKFTPVIAYVEISPVTTICKNEIFETYYAPSDRDEDVKILKLFHPNPEVQNREKNKTKIERAYLSTKAALDVLIQSDKNKS